MESRSLLESVGAAAQSVSDVVSRAPIQQSSKTLAPTPTAPGHSETVTHATPGGIGLIFSSLRHRNYRLLWIGTLLMSAGQWIQEVTLGWLMYDLTGSAALLGALNGFRSVPFLIFGPLAGVAADRLDRR